LQRFDRDVAAYKPKYVTILLGMNDGHYIPFDQATFDTYQKDMQEVLKRITDAGATPIPMTPTMFDARLSRQSKGWMSDDAKTLYNSVLAYYGTWLRDVAMENGYGFVDMWGPLNTITMQQRKTDPGFTLIADAVHPGPDGQLVMAAAVINDLGLPRRVSTIRLTRDAGGQFVPLNPQGGSLSDLVTGPEKIEFTWTGESLPWVVPADAARGAELTNMARRWSSESLEVHMLAPGRYTVTIDGTEVGTYPAEALERHIELGGNAKTPQYQQALEVAMLNKRRAEGPLKKLRDSWGQYQAYARTKKDAEAKPDDEAVQKRLQELEAAVADLDQRVERFNAEAKAIEDEIFTKNQPSPHRYVIQRVAGTNE
jgi:lysophospholipase L1-like esterase